MISILSVLSIYWTKKKKSDFNMHFQDTSTLSTFSYAYWHISYAFYLNCFLIFFSPVVIVCHFFFFNWCVTKTSLNSKASRSVKIFFLSYKMAQEITGKWAGIQREINPLHFYGDTHSTSVTTMPPFLASPSCSVWVGRGSQSHTALLCCSRPTNWG